MSRAVLATIFSVGCTFTPGTPSTPATPDATVPVVEPDAYQMSTCHSRVPGVQLCLDFEDGNLAHDSTGLPYSIDVQDVDPTTRGGQHAALLNEDSSIHVLDAPPLDTAGPLSMEMWVNPAAATWGQPDAFLVSSMYEYGFSISNGQLYCSLTAQGGGSSADLGSIVPITPGQWTHVACVFDGVYLKIYVDGNASACKKQAMQIESDVRDGLYLGFALVGGIDDIHIYSTALTDDDICTLAGGTGCLASKCD